MKNFILILVALVLNLASLAQAPTFKYTGNEFRPGINKFISHNQKVGLYIANYFIAKDLNYHEKLCNSGIGYVKFKVGPNGVSEIACTMNSPEILRDGLKEGVKASEKYWVVSEQSEVKLFLLPIMYDYRKSGCTDQTQLRDSFSKKLNEFDDGTQTHNSNYFILDPIVAISGPEDKF